MLVQKIHVAQLKHSFALISRSGPHPSGQSERNATHLRGIWKPVSTCWMWALMYEQQNCEINSYSCKWHKLHHNFSQSLCIFLCYIYLFNWRHLQSRQSEKFRHAGFSADCSRSSTGGWLQHYQTYPKLIIASHNNSAVTLVRVGLITQERQDRCVRSNAE